MIDKASGNDNNPDNIDRDIELNEYSAKLQVSIKLHDDYSKLQNH